MLRLASHDCQVEKTKRDRKTILPSRRWLMLNSRLCFFNRMTAFRKIRAFKPTKARTNAPFRKILHWGHFKLYSIEADSLIAATSLNKFFSMGALYRNSKAWFGTQQKPFEVLLVARKVMKRQIEMQVEISFRGSLPERKNAKCLIYGISAPIEFNPRSNLYPRLNSPISV